MLKKMRNKKTAKKIWIILAILILPAFILWGSGSLLRNKGSEPSGYTGKVFGRVISSLEFQDAIKAMHNQAIMQYGDNLSQIEKYLDFKSQAWERIILLAEAEKRKINVADKEVMDIIGNYPIFQRKAKFDDETYKNVLRYGFNTPARLFEEQIRQNIIISKLYKEITDKTKVSDEETKREYEKVNEQLSLYYIAAIPSDFTKEAETDERTLKEYFTNNQLQFKQPLSFNLEYILADSEDKIKTLFANVNNKERLDSLLTEMGISIKETGLFQETNPIPAIGFAPQATTLLSKAKIGQYLKPMQINKAYYLFSVKERKEPSIPDFGTVKDKVKESFIKDKTKEIAKIKIEETFEKLKQDSAQNPLALDFDKIAQNFGLKSSATELFKFGSYIEGIGSSDIFWTEAKNLKENEISGIIELPAGFYIIKVKSRVPMDENKFKEEGAVFSQRLLEQKKQEIFITFTEQLKTKCFLYNKS